MRYHLSSLFFAFLFLISASPVSAQGNAASVFEGAVDQINCETIRFIHREASRSEIANNMECLSFESILKSVPEDEANTTGKLAKDINAVKSRYKADKDLGTQLDAAISIAQKKIESKQRKQNIPDFKKRLADIKAEAIKNAAALAGGEAPDNTSASAPDDNAPATDATTTNEADENDGSIVIQPDSEESSSSDSTGGTDWLGLLSLIIALLALGLAGYTMLKKAPSKASASVYKPAADENAYRERDDASATAVKNLETRMQQEISRIRSEFDEKLAALTASTGYTEPESMMEPETVTYEMNGDVPSLSDAMVETMDLPLEPEAVEEIEEHNHEKNVEEKAEEPPLFAAANPASVMEVPVEEEPEMMDEATEQNEEKQPAQFEITSDEIESMPEPPAAPVHQVPRETSFASQPAEAEFEVAEEDEEGLPFYRYISAPAANGAFPDNGLSETAGQDSVYEIEMYEDVPNKAFFSPLPYPDVVAKILADPNKYLAPCCAYTDDPAGKQHIIVVEEGTLRKEGEQWMVHDKAKIRFA